MHTMITLRRPGFPALQVQLTPPHSQPYIVKLSSTALRDGQLSTMGYVVSSNRAGSGPRSDAAETEEVTTTTTNIRHEGDQDHANTRSNITPECDPSIGAQLGGE